MRRPADVKADLKMLEEAWNNYQVYLNDEIDFASDAPMIGLPLQNRPKESEQEDF